MLRGLVVEILAHFAQEVGVAITINNPQNHDSVTFLETSQQSLGSRTLLEVTLAPGGRNALHFHETFSERFEAVEGVLKLATATGTLELSPGESFTAEPYVEHAFFNDGVETVRFQVEIKPGNPSFELFLQVAYGLIHDTWTLPGGFPPNPLALGVLYALGDTHYKGFLYALSPMARLCAWLAVKVGTHRRLVTKYGQTLRLKAPG